MARRGVPKEPVNWFLTEWMATSRVTQAEMCRLTGWSKATMSQLYNHKQGYNPQLVEDAVAALKIETFELFIPPARAMALRQLRQSAAQIVQAEPAAASPLAPTEPPAESRTGTRG